MIEKLSHKTFQNESEAIKDFERILDNKSISKEDLLQQFKLLIKSNYSLLKNLVKLTNIGDINHKKLHEAYQEIETQKKELYNFSITDQLTTIYNRGYVIEFLQKEYFKSKRYHFNLSCILYDIDNFKDINDNFGHLVGDFALKKSAELIKEIIRDTDVFARYGGEEFLIVLPNTGLKYAVTTAEKIRTKVAAAVFELEDHKLNFTISLGVSDLDVNHPKTVDEMINNSDLALYRAKKNGKNKTVQYKI